MPHLCPVCGYPELDEPPTGDNGEASFAICPSCGTQFGHDDVSRTHAELRRQWVAEGGRWWSEVKAPPSNWSGSAQLRAAGWNSDG